jgi:hypothetical protein
VLRHIEEEHMSRKVLIGLAVAALATPSALWAELPKAEQICINKMNSDGVKVQAAQLKVTDGCIKDAVKTQLAPGPAANSCMDNDPKGKVDKKRDKTTSDLSKKCSPPATIFYSGDVTTNDAAEDSAKALARDAFGPTMGALLSCDTNAAECACQTKITNRLSKLERAMAKQWLACKKDAMTANGVFSPGGATTNGQLEQCVTQVAVPLSVQADGKQKISKAKGQLKDSADAFCAKGSVDEFAGGECAGFSTPPTLDSTGLANCMEQIARCRLCEMINATDALAVDCDAWAGITCP